MSAEGLSQDVLVSVAIETSNSERTGQYEMLAGDQRAEQIALDALEDHIYATDAAERLDKVVAMQAVGSQIAQI